MRKTLVLRAPLVAIGAQKQGHLMTVSKLPSLSLQAFVNSDFKISILALFCISQVFRCYRSTIFDTNKKIVNNFGFILRKLLLVCLKNPSLYSSFQFHDYTPESDQKWKNVKILLTYPLDPLNLPPRGPPLFENLIYPLFTPCNPYFTP